MEGLISLISYREIVFINCRHYCHAVHNSRPQISVNESLRKIICKTMLYAVRYEQFIAKPFDRDNFTADNGLYIMYILKLCSVIVMVTPVTVQDKFQEDGDLIYAGEYLDIAGTPNGDYTKKLRVRRLICRVCKLKFRTRQETQAHIKSEHRRA